MKILGYHYDLHIEGTVDSIGAAERFLSVPQIIQ